LAPPSKEKGELSSDRRRGEEDSTHNLNAATNEKKVIWTKAPHLHLVGRNLEVLREVLIDPRRETSVPPPPMATNACWSPSSAVLMVVVHATCILKRKQ
jgi:hypothetical protein